MRCQEDAGLDRAGHAPEKYNSREAPIEVALPADIAAAWAPAGRSCRRTPWASSRPAIWLREPASASAAAKDAAAGWGGDRIAVLEGPDEAWAIAWQTAWDTGR